MRIDDLPDRLFLTARKPESDEIFYFYSEGGNRFLLIWSSDRQYNLWARKQRYDATLFEFDKTYVIATAMSQDCDYLIFNPCLDDDLIPTEKLVDLRVMSKELRDNSRERI